MLRDMLVARSAAHELEIMGRPTTPVGYAKREHYHIVLAGSAHGHIEVGIFPPTDGGSPQGCKEFRPGGRQESWDRRACQDSSGRRGRCEAEALENRFRRPP